MAKTSRGPRCTPHFRLLVCASDHSHFFSGQCNRVHDTADKLMTQRLGNGKAMAVAPRTFGVSSRQILKRGCYECPATTKASSRLSVPVHLNTLGPRVSASNYNFMSSWYSNSYNAPSFSPPERASNPGWNHDPSSLSFEGQIPPQHTPHSSSSLRTYQPYADAPLSSPDRDVHTQGSWGWPAGRGLTEKKSIECTSDTFFNQSLALMQVP
jgi:hypothetical protein